MQTTELEPSSRPQPQHIQKNEPETHTQREREQSRGQKPEASRRQKGEFTVMTSAAAAQFQPCSGFFLPAAPFSVAFSFYTRFFLLLLESCPHFSPASPSLVNPPNAPPAFLPSLSLPSMMRTRDASLLSPHTRTHSLSAYARMCTCVCGTHTSLPLSPQQKALPSRCRRRRHFW